ncbi:unnamed protein product, partial [Closterium sp. NIES-54]
MDAASSARSRPSTLSVSVVSAAPNKVAHTRRTSVAAGMGGGKDGGAGICGGARWHPACSAAMVLLAILGFAKWELFHAGNRTKWSRRSEFAILFSTSVSSSSYSHNSSSHSHSSSSYSHNADSRKELSTLHRSEFEGSEGGDSPGADSSASDASSGDASGGDSADSITASIESNHAVPAVPAVPVFPAASLCDLYHGRWVHTRQRALYSGERCKWISLNWACARSNRPREMRDYERLRWQPRGCSAEQFSAEGFFR